MLVRQAITSGEGTFNPTDLIPSLLAKAHDQHNYQLSDSINTLKKDLEAKSKALELASWKVGLLGLEQKRS